jgi:hypothetical protein
MSSSGPQHAPHDERQAAASYDGGPDADSDAESYNPWSIVNLVFTHLTDQGLHPVLGESGDPGPPARALLTALGIEPAAEGNREVMREVRAHLAEIRAVMFEEE